MITDKVVKYGLIFGLALIFFLQSNVDETVIGLSPSDLNKLAAPIFVFFFVFGFFIAVFFYWLSFALMLIALIALIVWWRKGRVWSITLASVVIAGVVAGVAKLFGVPGAGILGIAAAMLVTLGARCKGRKFSDWIDQFSKREIVFYTLIVLLFLPAVDLQTLLRRFQVSPVDAEVPPYTTWYPRELNERALKAAARFPDPQSCLAPGKEETFPADLVAMDWTLVRHKTEAEVCIFRLLSALPGIGASRGFIEAQGFRMPRQNFSAENPYVETRNNALRVTGSWSIRNNGPKFPTHGIFRRWRASIPYGMSVDVFYDSEGLKVLAVRISYSTV